MTVTNSLGSPVEESRTNLAFISIQAVVPSFFRHSHSRRFALIVRREMRATAAPTTGKSSARIKSSATLPTISSGFEPRTLNVEGDASRIIKSSPNATDDIDAGGSQPSSGRTVLVYRHSVSRAVSCCGRANRPSSSREDDREFRNATSHPDGIIQLCPSPLSERNQKIATAYCFRA